jgi:mevalonate kinase
VLDGAAALAVPTRQGQSLHIEDMKQPMIRWKSWDSKGESWFDAIFDLVAFDIVETSDLPTAVTLRQFFQVIETETSFFSRQAHGFRCETRLEFPRDWGLGSSSTLIYLLATWTGANPYFLLEKTMGGSGYDIACAGIDSAIVYQRNGNTPNIQLVDFQPAFAKNLYFIHLGKKQNSREGITRYREKKEENNVAIKKIDDFTNAILQCNSLEILEQIIVEHETFVADYLAVPRAKELYFSDFWGEIKSLGAWGGDFVLATSLQSEAETVAYFQQKGFTTIVPYGKMIL